MNPTFENAMQQVQLGEELMAAAVEELVSRWQTSVTAIGKLCKGTERWQAVIRETQTAAVNLADILRARTA